MRTKTDKIFDNKYESTEIDTTPIKYENQNDSASESVDYKLIFEEVELVIKGDKRLLSLSESDGDGNWKKLNKVQINEVYSKILQKLPNLPRIEIWSSIGEYYDISTDKFYDSLSNKFKIELLEELKEREQINDQGSGPLF